MILSYRIFLVLGLVVLSRDIVAQCSDWEKIFDYKFVTFGDLDQDRFGNTYVTGTYFEDGFTLGSNTFHLPSSPASGSLGAFIAKFDKNHILIWAISPATNYRAMGKQVEVTADDGIIVAGDFDSSFIMFGCSTFTGSGRSDIYVVKLRPDGSPEWLTGSTGADDSYVEQIKMSPNGNCILISNFIESSDVTQGLSAPDVKMGDVPVMTGSSDQINAGFDSFVASINADGSVAWTQGIGGDGNQYDYVQGVATDSRNNVIVTGLFSSPQISFDGQLVHSFTISENYYVAKIDSNGETLWVKETEGGINQSGWGVGTDADDHIFVSGRYYGDAKFGPFTLAGKGDSDVFVVKLGSDGTTLNARGIGNDGFDAGTGLEVNRQGQVLVSAYYYSHYLEVGTFSSTQSAVPNGDSFIATLSNDLAVVECARFITGDGEAIVWNFDLDKYDNVIAEIRMMFWNIGDEVIVGSRTYNDSDHFSLLAVLGNQVGPDEGEMSGPVKPKVALGKDTTLCPGEKLKLTAPKYCSAKYQWSTGSTNASIDVTTPGIYWVDLTWNGFTVRDDIEVLTYQPIMAMLGDDQWVCPGEFVAWSLPNREDAIYKWSNGGNSYQNTVTGPGTYWVEVSNRCETVRDDVTLRLKPPAVVELGGDIIVCDNDITLRYTLANDESLRWSDGSTSSSLLVSESGTYTLTVFNGCNETTDSVKITFRKPITELPNVVTANDDGMNDHLILPLEGEKYSLTIFNRWGEKVFYDDDYLNQWPFENISPGVYFYTLKSECTPFLKGAIHVLR